MNEIDSKLPEIDEKGCHYAIIEYEINQILKEFNLPNNANNDTENSLDYIYSKLSVVHNQVKLLKAENKNLNIDIINLRIDVGNLKINAQKPSIIDLTDKDGLRSHNRTDIHSILDENGLRSLNNENNENRNSNSPNKFGELDESIFDLYKPTPCTKNEFLNNIPGMNDFDDFYSYPDKNESKEA